MQIDRAAIEGDKAPSPGPWLLLLVLICGLAALVWPRGEPGEADQTPTGPAQLALAPPTPGAGPCPARYTPRAGVHALSIPYCGDLDLGARGAIPGVGTLLLWLGEGDGRGGYQAARQALGDGEGAAVLAPAFLSEEALAADPSLGEGVAFFGGRWWAGSLSATTDAHPRPTRVSSFAFIDGMIRDVVARGRLPDLRRIVVAGSEAGADAALRWAAAGIARAPEGASLSVVALHPRSYLWLTSERPRPDDPQGAFIPEGMVYGRCRSYDDWPYGMLDPFSYAKQSGRLKMMERLGGRALTVILPEAELHAPPPAQRAPCALLLQGATPAARAQGWAAHRLAALGAEVEAHQRTVVAPGASAADLSASACARAALSGGDLTAACAPLP